MAKEFFQTVVSLAEESNMIDVWKMAIDKNLENPNKNLVDYINDEGDFDFQPVFAGRITLVKSELVSLLGSEQELEGIYTDTELSVDELIQQMLRRTIPVIGKPVHTHVFDEESPLAGYKLTAYPSEKLGLGGIILIGQLPYSANAFKIDLEKSEIIQFSNLFILV